jgi:ketosteroid isomerase-like protein
LKRYSTSCRTTSRGRCPKWKAFLSQVSELAARASPNFFATVGALQEPLKFEPRELIAEGDRVIGLGSYEWRVKANGREFGGDFAHAWTIRDGKVVGFHEYTDTAACIAAHQKTMTA